MFRPLTPLVAGTSSMMRPHPAHRPAAPPTAPTRQISPNNIHGPSHAQDQVRDMSAFMSGGEGMMSAERAAALRAERWANASKSTGISEPQSVVRAREEAAEKQKQAKKWKPRNSSGPRSDGPQGGGGISGGGGNASGPGGSVGGGLGRGR